MREVVAECVVMSRVPRALYDAIEAERARTSDAMGVKVTMSSMVRAILARALLVRKRKPKRRRS
jgi:hypothetical protein